MPLSLIQASAVLGRAKTLARGLCLGIQREFEYVRAIGDWHRKLRVMRAACWSLHTAICEETPSWVSSAPYDDPESSDAAAICRPWIQRSMARIDRELDDIQSWLSPGFEQRATRYSAERAIKATFSILRVMTDVANWLESAQIETGVDTSTEQFKSVVAEWALPTPLGADPFELIERDFADADAVLTLQTPLELCMVMRSLWCHYQFAMAIRPGLAQSKRLNERARELHQKAIERTNEISELQQLGRPIYTSFFAEIPNAAAMIEACLEANHVRERELGEKLCSGEFLKLAGLPDCLSLIDRTSRPLANTAAIRILVIDLPKLRLEPTWGEQFELQHRSWKDPSQFGLCDLAIVNAECLPSDERQLEQLRSHAARMVCIGKTHTCSAADSVDEHHLRHFTGSIDAIDRHFIHVYLTDNASPEWCRKALATRQAMALGNLSDEWIVLSYLLPEFPLSPGEPTEFKNLKLADAIRKDLLTEPFNGAPPKSFSQITRRKLSRIKGAAFLDVVTSIENAFKKPPVIAAAWRPLVAEYGLTEGSLAERVPSLLS